MAEPAPMLGYIRLGSNRGERKEHIRQAIARLRAEGLRINRISPLVESPALLLPTAPSAWNRPCLHLVLEVETEQGLQSWRPLCEAIARRLNAGDSVAEAPRAIDIDLLCCEGDDSDGMQAADWSRRNFVITPLTFLRPDLRVPGSGGKTVFDCSLELQHPIPLWMWILNITPDSFSDGGVHRDWPAIEAELDAAIAAGVHILDIGAESTRPRARPIGPEEEWQRLLPILQGLHDKFANDCLRPLYSIDTRHAQTAGKVLEWGADIINDVSGLTDPAMRELARDSDRQWIAMHHLTVPADPAVLLPEGCDAYAEVEQWMLRRLDDWDKAGLDSHRILFDPGIGFGKSSLQSLELLRRAGDFRRHGLRVLIGHSRKSFLKDFVDLDPVAKDLATLGASLQLCEQGVDIIRVHDVTAHLQAYRGWAHVQGHGVSR